MKSCDVELEQTQLISMPPHTGWWIAWSHSMHQGALFKLLWPAFPCGHMEGHGAPRPEPFHWMLFSKKARPNWSFSDLVAVTCSQIRDGGWVLTESLLSHNRDNHSTEPNCFWVIHCYKHWGLKSISFHFIGVWADISAASYCQTCSMAPCNTYPSSRLQG